MKDQHTKIDGYRSLDQTEIDQINECKRVGRELETLIQDLRKNPATDKRWVSIAETHLQQGIMASVRSIAKPDGF